MGRQVLAIRNSADALQIWLLALIQSITDAADGTDGIGLIIWTERLAEAAYMDIDGAVVDVVVARPDEVEQLVAAPDPTWAFHQGAQQAVFGGADMQRRAAALHPMLFSVHGYIAESEDLARR